MDRVPHAHHRYDDELTELRGVILRMAAACRRQLVDATDALMAADGARAAAVVERDVELDVLEDEIDAMTLKLLALRNPVAVDLRFVFGAMKIGLSIERVGDYAANIAKRTTVLAKAGTIGSMNGFDRIGALVLANFDAVVEAFERDNVDLADRVRGADEEVDRIYDGIFRELLTHMAENPRNITIATHLMFVAKNYERIGDQATNIAEMVHFIGKGDVMPDRHTPSEPASANGALETETER